MDMQKRFTSLSRTFFARKTQDSSLITFNMRSDIGMISCTACEVIVVFHFNWQSGVSHLAIWVGPPGDLASSRQNLESSRWTLQPDLILFL